MNNKKWLITVFILSFTLSAIFGAISYILANNLSTFFIIPIILVVISIGIIFDMVGVAVLTSKEANLHAKAAKKASGAREGISLIKNSTKVSSVCNDVIGDICGIVSGSLGAVLTLAIANKFKLSSTLTTILVTAVISSLTVGFKAVFKVVATKKADDIVLLAGKIKKIFTFYKD